MERVGGWMQTYTGGRYYPVDPLPSEVGIEDIAHALSMLCRFGGHCHTFYSVAEHSVHVSRLVPREHALVGLLHDATEAYVCDVPRPLKLSLPEYKNAEHLNWLAIAAHFSLASSMPAVIKHADNAILHVEQRVLMRPDPGRDWCVGDVGPIDTRDVRIECWSPKWARETFFDRYHNLTGK